uniref:Uncharacterized protein n=1 Tax=Thermosphaera aggregans TaxID=54254 RepID=A0A7C2BKH7_9CREN
MDTIFTHAYHKAIEYAVETNRVVSAGGLLIVKREFALNKGGWRDLNYSEDVEFVSRVGFNDYLPIVPGFNEPLSAFMGAREKRYGGFKRVVKATIDLLRGGAHSMQRLLICRGKRATAFYIPARLFGVYKNREPDNLTWLELASLVKAIPLRKAGIDEEYFRFESTLPLLTILKDGEKVVDEKVSSLVSGRIYKFYLAFREPRIAYYKNQDSFTSHSFR